MSCRHYGEMTDQKTLWGNGYNMSMGWQILFRLV